MTINLSGIGIDYGAILPELVVAGTAIVVLFLELVVPPDRRRWLAAVTVIGLLGALVATIPLWGQNRSAFGDTVIADSLAAFFNVLLIAITILTVAISPRYLHALDLDYGEYYILILGATAGMMLLAAATSLMTIFLGIELLSISLYVLSGFARTAREHDAHARRGWSQLSPGSTSGSHGSGRRVTSGLTSEESYEESDEAYSRRNRGGHDAGRERDLGKRQREGRLRHLDVVRGGICADVSTGATGTTISGTLESPHELFVRQADVDSRADRRSIDATASSRRLPLPSDARRAACRPSRSCPRDRRTRTAGPSSSSTDTRRSMPDPTSSDLRW